MTFIYHLPDLDDGSNSVLSPVYPNPTVVMSTHDLRALLPYRNSPSPGMFINHHCIGFGLQLLLHKSMAMQTIQEILQNMESITSCEVHYSLIVHHHCHTKKSKATYHYYLFASIVSLSMPSDELLDKLLSVHQQVCLELGKHHIRSTALQAKNFLIFLRTLISPNLDKIEDNGPVEIDNKSFHEIIPNQGTIFTLSTKHIDIISANAMGLFRKNRLLLNHINKLEEDASFWLPLNDMFQYLSRDWLLSLTIVPRAVQTLQASFVLITPPHHAHDDWLSIQKHYSTYRLSLESSATPLHTFLTSLPFGYTECTASLS